MITLEALLGIDELSKELGINKYTLYKKIRKDKFPKGIKVNGRRLFKPETIKEYYNGFGIDIVITQRSKPSFM
jgi:predicted DNA-binding transcriptional regulator AlpA